MCPRRGLRSLPVHSQRRCAHILHDASHRIVLVTYYSLIFFRSTHSSPPTALHRYSQLPTKTPTSIPTASPSNVPTAKPSFSPTVIPTAGPVFAGGCSPVELATCHATLGICSKDTSGSNAVLCGCQQGYSCNGVGSSGCEGCTVAPSKAPTRSPSASPSMVPTVKPTAAPTALPSHHPSKAPTFSPSETPSGAPTTRPTVAPSAAPTTRPSKVPTASPSQVRMCRSSFSVLRTSVYASPSNHGAHLLRSPFYQSIASFSPSRYRLVLQRHALRSARQ